MGDHFTQRKWKTEGGGGSKENGGQTGHKRITAHLPWLNCDALPLPNSRWMYSSRSAHTKTEFHTLMKDTIQGSEFLSVKKQVICLLTVQAKTEFITLMKETINKTHLGSAHTYF